MMWVWNFQRSLNKFCMAACATGTEIKLQLVVKGTSEKAKSKVVLMYRNSSNQADQRVHSTTISKAVLRLLQCTERAVCCCIWLRFLSFANSHQSAPLSKPLMQGCGGCYNYWVRCRVDQVHCRASSADILMPNCFVLLPLLHCWANKPIMT